MKKYKVLFSVLILLIAMWAAVFPAQAADHPEEPYYITAYHVDIDVSEDNVLSITEEIDVYFNEERHGIYRTIPTRNEVVRADGSTAVTRAKIRNISCSEDYEKSTENSDLVLQIGDADVTVTGDKHYTISYDYVLGQDVADGYDELYFNIIGDGWDTYIDFVSFTITMPKEFDSSLLGFSTGGYGFTGSDIVEYYTDGLEIEGFLWEELEPYQALTVRLELEEGYFYFNQVLHMLKLSTMALIPLACLIFVFIIWLKYGREKKVIETVEFYPPEGMNSADVAYWYKGKLPKKDIVALLIELANEGYIAIHDGDEAGSGAYRIERIKPYPHDLDEDKKRFFEGLFESGKDMVTGSDLRNKFYRTLNQISSNYGYSGEKGRIHTLKSTRLQLLCWLLVIGGFVLDVVILANVLGGNERFIPFVIGVPILAGAFWLACYVPGRTEESHKNLEKITGFKKFLETAEKDRLEMLVHDNPKYFYNILPFAYVLGVSDKWVDKFEGIAIEPPEWYSGRDVFTAATMWHAMDRTLSSAASAMSSAPRQSSSGGGSGSSGGGVSGGGSGGGGGGSW